MANSNSQNSSKLNLLLVIIIAPVATGIFLLAIEYGYFQSDETSDQPVVEAADQEDVLTEDVCIVPNLIGLDEISAEISLRKLDLRPVKSNEYNNSLPAGAIISQTPSSSSRLEPCAGEVIIVVSLGAIPTKTPASTPEPSFTSVPESPLPKKTSIPQVPEPTSTTSIPAPTIVSQDTLPGSILEAGEEWKQDGVALRLTRFNLDPGDSYYDGINVGFQFRNNTDTELIISFTKNDFLAFANNGQSLFVRGFYNRSFWCNETTALVEAQSSFSLEDDVCGITHGYLLNIDVDLSNPGITEVIVHVTQLSRITDAKWRIPINR
ncbi:MAG: PASTA domain-containing protein [Chloroflexi bacterium]|nr:PASTA domain-containing protein [Ardenticatenaceae bacterium]MBL1131054.1 PASTA domain-containing protein [Chloroflexota bacterium]NOG37153.1 PASTA domain-containing protein [Chloroflexota bacterium]GIK58314.1 MAG: hypothetical protein BroJett015_39770 [Chloroflexota bacterium]